jgi:hypothetical protein
MTNVKYVMLIKIMKMNRNISFKEFLNINENFNLEQKELHEEILDAIMSKKFKMKINEEDSNVLDYPRLIEKDKLYFEFFADITYKSKLNKGDSTFLINVSSDKHLDYSVKSLKLDNFELSLAWEDLNINLYDDGTEYQFTLLDNNYNNKKKFLKNIMEEWLEDNTSMKIK